jgi:hypothetical protein
MAVYIFVLIGWLLQSSSAFQVGSRIGQTALTRCMAGGRSPVEKTMSKKRMFQELKLKFKQASNVPGFFQVGDGPPVSFIPVIFSVILRFKSFTVVLPLSFLSW